jgi:hypothetical protein
VTLGERDTDFVSTYLRWADFGLATVPAALVEKSGSVAAMVEHGLRVIVTSDNWQLPGCSQATEWSGPDIYSLSAASSVLTACGLPKGRIESRREGVTSSFLNMLQSSI